MSNRVFLLNLNELLTITRRKFGRNLFFRIKTGKDNSDYESNELNFGNGDVIRGQVLRLTRESERSTADGTIYFVDEDDEFPLSRFSVNLLELELEMENVILQRCFVFTFFKNYF